MSDTNWPKFLFNDLEEGLPSTTSGIEEADGEREFALSPMGLFDCKSATSPWPKVVFKSPMVVRDPVKPEVIAERKGTLCICVWLSEISKGICGGQLALVIVVH